MLFSAIILLLVAAVVYFHYTQGFFSATISAICAVLAAVFAFSYHEVVIYSLLRGKVADYAHGMILVALFAAIYTILRVLFDSMVPGNLRFPPTLDKVGAAAMGVVAGIFALGIFAVAAQALPFGPSIGMYTRYKTQGQADVQVPTRRQAEDTYAYNVLGSEKPGEFAEADRTGLLIPVDDMLVNLVSRLSEGSMSGNQRLLAVHPAYLDELFAQRFGIQVGASRVALNVKGLDQVSVQGVYTLDSVPQADSEIPDIRKGAPLTKIDDLLKPLPNQIMLIVRTMFSSTATDSDKHFRFSPASIRLMAGGKNYHPVGSLDSDMVLRVNRIDDFVIVGADRGADLVFLIDRADLGLGGAAPKRGEPAGEAKMGPGTFLEVKRMGVVDLSGKSIDRDIQPAENIGPVRKKATPPAKAAPQPQQTAAPSADAPLVEATAAVSDKLFSAVNVGGFDEGSELTFGSGKATLKDKKFMKLAIDATQTLALLKRGEYTVDEFFVPPGMKMVLVTAKPPAQAPPEPWAWADELGQFALIDAAGNAHKPHGAWAKLSAAGGQLKMVGEYDATKPVASVPQGEGRPTEVWIAFIVPVNTSVKQLHFKEKVVQALNLDVK